VLAEEGAVLRSLALVCKLCLLRRLWRGLATAVPVEGVELRSAAVDSMSFLRLLQLAVWARQAVVPVAQVPSAAQGYRLQDLQLSARNPAGPEAAEMAAREKGHPVVLELI